MPSTAQRLPMYRSSGARMGHVRGTHRRWKFRYLFFIVAGCWLLRQWIRSIATLSEDTAAPPLDTQFKELAIARTARIDSPTDTVIPKIVHFVYGLRGPEPTLDLVHYLAIKSAHDVLSPEKIIFHYHYMPVGEMFEKAKSMLTLRPVPLVTEVFGQPVSHYAHQADVVRLTALQQFGGIYLDLDLISLQPIDHLLQHEFVMAQEGIGGSVGLCNAMVMARPNARFLQRWYATYRSFDSSDWNYHSVVLPGKLAPHFPNEITVLNYTAFFWPLWDGPGLRTLYLEKSYDFANNFGTHIWESAANKHLMKGITEDDIMNIDNSLFCQMRRFLLDGQPDPRPDACRILPHTTRSDQLVGHWQAPPIKEGEANFLPLEDDSGNNVNGIARHVTHHCPDKAKRAVHVNGEDSYLFLSVPTETSIDRFTVSWWMQTSSDKHGGTAMVIQTEHAKLYVRTEKLDNALAHNGTVPISLGLSTLIRDDWIWRTQENDQVQASPFPINMDLRFHHYTLVIDHFNRSTPPIILYMDGHVIASNNRWEWPPEAGSIVHGVWFGSSEPEKSNYQDPWDTDLSLEACYDDIRIWERSLSLDEIQKLAQERPVESIVDTSSSLSSS
ncbi:uncharacterized protein BYT42DRAFT_601838 [Radiomyces spectabilis]|uniref:uncharacterized protein n=1 Tax=Radiomyces spectabilis TaxID=64574 RepID=UPI00221EA0C3|nr:uncharacterized protein BYT42DRAFT_601838 [Radiomyces spectabilis]KAI8390850.1 hypothetical protein BYT42DRAFT_601838 [Radiomyces spectabilis]